MKLRNVDSQARGMPPNKQIDNSRSMSLNEAVCPCLTSQIEKLNTDRQLHLRTSTENWCYCYV